MDHSDRKSDSDRGTTEVPSRETDNIGLAATEAIVRFTDGDGARRAATRWARDVRLPNVNIESTQIDHGTRSPTSTWQQMRAKLRAKADHYRTLAPHREYIRRKKLRATAPSVDPFGLDHAKCATWWPRIKDRIFDSYRIELSGMHLIPDNSGVLLIANLGDPSAYDYLALMATLRYQHSAHRTLRPLVPEHVIHSPFVGPLLCSLGAIQLGEKNARAIMQSDAVLLACWPGRPNEQILAQRERRALRTAIECALERKIQIVPLQIDRKQKSSFPFVKTKTWRLCAMPRLSRAAALQLVQTFDSIGALDARSRPPPTPEHQGDHKRIANPPAGHRDPQCE